VWWEGRETKDKVNNLKVLISADSHSSANRAESKCVFYFATTLVV
jgi:hypothetical protein